MYYGHALSIGEKWKKGFEIAGIIVGTLLILPIPILALTGSYKRLARLGVELNNNISIEAKVNKVVINLLDSNFITKNKFFRYHIKKFENKIDKDIIKSAQSRKLDVQGGRLIIEVGVHTDAKKSWKSRKPITKIEYEFNYDLKTNKLIKKVINTESNIEALGETDEVLYDKLYFAREAPLMKDGKIQYDNGKTLHLFGMSTSESCTDLDNPVK